jgi:DNA polymerase III epsilon subunit-like protein
VIFDEKLEQTFYGRTRPISERFVPDALGVSGFSREQHLKFEDPKEVMAHFADWLGKYSKGHPTFVSDNPAFDWQFINYYFHRFLGATHSGFQHDELVISTRAWSGMRLRHRTGKNSASHPTHTTLSMTQRVTRKL